MTTGFKIVTCGLLSGCIGATTTAAVTGNLITTKSNNEETKVNKKTGEEEIDIKFDTYGESLAKYRYSQWMGTKNLSDKQLLDWKKLPEWKQKVKKYITQRDKWPQDILFLEERTDKHFAQMLRLKCYAATEAMEDSKYGKKVPRDLFKVVDTTNTQNLATEQDISNLCSSETTTTEEEGTLKVTNVEAKQLRRFNYDFLAGDLEAKLRENFKNSGNSETWFKEKKEGLSHLTTQEILKDYYIYEITYNNGEVKYELKHDWGKLFNSLEESSLFKGLIVKKAK